MTETDGNDMFKNVMVALGLGPDEEYDDRYFDDDELVGMDDLDADAVPERPLRDRSASRASAPVAESGMSVGSGGSVGAVRPIRAVGADEEASFTVRPIARDDAASAVSAVSPVVASKPRMLTPQSFGDAKVLADEFRRSTPVIMQLSDVDRDLARRLIDFASGVCYSLGGSMEKMASNVFLLVPKGAEVSADERRRIEERGFNHA